MSRDHDPQMAGAKHCPHCDKMLSVINFAVDPSAPDGLAYVCRSCHSERTKNSPSKRKARDLRAQKKTRNAGLGYNYLPGTYDSD